jgi:hypothetical protein
MEKKKKSSAGLAVVVLAAAVKLIANEDSGLSISLFYMIALAALLFGAYWLFRRLRGRTGGSSRPDAARLRNNPRDFSNSRRKRKARASPGRGTLSPGNASRGKEQWKSLYEAGLIDRDEYREKLEKME